MAGALLAPEPGRYDFCWLDHLLDLLHDNGIRVDLGTPTVVPPARFYERHPDALPVNRDGVRYAFGGRGAISHSSPAYQRAAGRSPSSWAGATASTPRWRCGTCTASTARR